MAREQPTVDKHEVDAMLIIILLYVAAIFGAWYLAKYLAKATLKDRYRRGHAIILYLVLLPLIIIALGFVALAIAPVDV